MPKLKLFKVGNYVLPIRIIPLESTSLAAARALATNHAQAETYDLNGETPLIISAFGIIRDICMLVGWKPVVKFGAHWVSWELFVEMVVPF
jgi:hypothetical protein